MSGRSIAVVVRTRTAGDEAFRLLEALAVQMSRPVEVVVVDSGSAQPVLRKLRRLAAGGSRRLPLTLIEVAGPFDSAGLLNRGIAATDADLVAILSQDALPETRDYLERLAAAFDDPRVAGAYGRQVAGPGADPLAEKDLLRTYPDSSRTQHAPDCRFVNTCSMVRRELWALQPFESRAVISEDHRWAQRMQQRGHVVRYRADARVIHHHPFRDPAATWRRFYLEGRGLAWVHGSAPPGRAALLGAAREAASDALWLLRRRTPRHWPRALAHRAIKHAALYWGGRRGAGER